MTGIHEERNQRLEPTHLTIPLLQQDSSSRAYSWVVDGRYFYCIPVVVPRYNAVQQCEEERGFLLELFYHILPSEVGQLVNWNGAKGRDGGLLAQVGALLIQLPQQLLDYGSFEVLLPQHSLGDGWCVAT